MVRPSATGLATAFFRLYLLESLAAGPFRPATLLAAIATERLPFAAGAFGRALQSLIEGGYIAPAAAANVCLTSLGAAERVQERERWAEMLPTLVRLLGDAEPRPFPVVARVAPPAPTGRDAARAERLRTLVRARLDELMRTMTSTVRAFGTARWNVRAGAATWSDEVATTTVLLRQAEAALAGDNDRRDAA